MRKKFPHPWPHCQTQSYHAYQTAQTPVCSNPLMLPIIQVCHERQIWLRFHWILKVVLKMAFSAHCTRIWKFNPISTTIISKVAQKCIWCCQWVQWCMTVPYGGGKLCNGAWKCGQDSHISMFSLCLPIWIKSMFHYFNYCWAVDISWLSVWKIQATWPVTAFVIVQHA